MTTSHLNKLVMYLAPRSYIEKPEFQTALSHVPGFRQAWESFLEILQVIRHRSQLSQELMSTAATENKVSLREAMAVAGAKISAGLVSWAEVNRNIELARSAHLTKSSLLGGRALEAAICADSFLALARKYVGKLDDYGVTQERLDDFDDLCQQFSESIGRPRAIIDERKLANDALPKLFSDADEILARMDRLAVLVEEKHPDFAEGYRGKRRVTHSSGSRPLVREPAAVVPANGSHPRSPDAEHATGEQSVLAS